MGDQATEQKPLVFISHRHEDGALATAVREGLLAMSNDGVECFQSGGDWPGQLPPGSVINHELAGRLQRTELLLLIYTRSDHDWSYPMWEAGVALDPLNQASTVIVVLQFGSDRPAPLSNLRSIDVTDEADVVEFVRSFLTSERMFPIRGRPLTGHDPGDQYIHFHAEQFRARLQEVPRRKRFFICHGSFEAHAAKVLRSFLQKIGAVDVRLSDDLPRGVGHVDADLREELAAFDHIIWLGTQDDERVPDRIWQTALSMAWSDLGVVELTTLRTSPHTDDVQTLGRTVDLLDARQLQSLVHDVVADPSFKTSDEAKDASALDRFTEQLREDMGEALRQGRKPTLYLCHTRTGIEAARALAELVGSTGLVDVFLSSEQQGGLVPPLSEDSTKRLRACDHIWLLHLDDPATLASSAWQAALALGISEGRGPRFTYLHAHHEVPGWLTNRVRFDLSDEGDLRELAHRLCSEANYFPSLGQPLGALVPEWDDADHVRGLLHAVLAERVGPPTEDDRWWPAHPLMRFALDLELSREVRDLCRQDRVRDAERIIVEHTTVLSSDRSAKLLLNDLDISEGTPLKPLLSLAGQDSPDGWELDEDWKRSLVAQMRDAAASRIPVPDWATVDPAQSLSQHVPMVVQVIRSYRRQRIEVEMIFVRYESDDHGEMRVAPSPARSSS